MERGRCRRRVAPARRAAADAARADAARALGGVRGEFERSFRRAGVYAAPAEMPTLPRWMRLKMGRIPDRSRTRPRRRRAIPC